MTNSNETSRPKRSKYTDEFKDQIRSEAQGKYDNETIVKLAKKHQIPRSTIRNWLSADSLKTNEQQVTTLIQSPQYTDRSFNDKLKFGGKINWQKIVPIIILLAIIVLFVFIFKPLVHIIYIFLILALVISLIAGFFAPTLFGVAFVIFLALFPIYYLDSTINPSKFEQHTKTAIAEATIETQPQSQQVKESPETKANNYLSSAKTNFQNNELYESKANANQALALNSSLVEAQQLLVAISKKEEEIKSAIANEKWTKENIINKLKVDEVLQKEVEFIYTGIGCTVEPHDTGMGKTNLKNAYTLDLSVAKNGKTITNDSQRKEVAFNIAKAINNNFSKIDFNLSEVFIHFADTDNPSGFGGGNFDLGINTIKNYFSKPRSQSGYIDGGTGEVVTLDFDSTSFYKWIEDNFTMPEDHSVLAENFSWTTMSQKGAIK